MTIRDVWRDSSRHNGRANVANMKSIGVVGIYSRCTIGVAPVDEQYFATKEQCESEGVQHAAYGVLWPQNRNPELDAQHFVENLTSGASPKMPVAAVGDFELGTNPNHGSYAISGEELVEQAIRWCRKVESLVSIPVLFYTAKWYWNNPKLLPFTNRGENSFPGIFANYPYDPRQIKYLPPRYVSKYDPAEIGSATVLVAYPWTQTGTVGGWQWTSKLPGAKDGMCESTFLDGDLMYVRFVDGTPPLPGGPTEAERIRDETAAIRVSADKLDQVAAELEAA